MWVLRDGGRSVRVSLLLFDAQRLVARGDALSHSVLLASLARMLGAARFLARRVSFRRTGGGRYAVTNAHARRRRDYRAYLLLFFLASACFYGVAKSDVGEYPDAIILAAAMLAIAPADVCATALSRRDLADDSAVKVERSDGRLFRIRHARSIGLNPGSLKLLFFYCASLPWRPCKPLRRSR